MVIQTDMDSKRPNDQGRYLSKSAEQRSEPGCGLKTVTLPFTFTFDHSDVVEASPVGAAPTTSNYIFILYLTPGFNRLGKDNCKTRWETFKFGELVCLISRGLTIYRLLSARLQYPLLTHWRYCSLALSHPYVEAAPGCDWIKPHDPQD